MHALTHFIGGTEGAWRLDAIHPVTGGTLPAAPRLAVIDAAPDTPPTAGAWTLRGFGSNQRYTTRTEDTALKAIQAGLGRDGARCAALIPIRKSATWWALPQDERRAIFEETSHHTAIGLEYLPAIARRLFHARDLGEEFDFLTWFEFAPTDAPAFDDLLRRLRATAEWRFVERELELRLSRD